MAIDNQRRRLIKWAGRGLVASPMLAPTLVSGMSSSVAALRDGDLKPQVIGCGIQSQDRYEAVVSDVFGQAIHRLPLPDRGHGVAVSGKHNQCAVFARRPGSFAVILDFNRGENQQVILASHNRHFYGHGDYSQDGRWLYATEGESHSSEGIIGVYDVHQQYQKVAEWRGFGIGPHELKVLENGDLVVAVGGVHTQGRTPINLQTMQPNLSYLSSEGKLLEQVSLGDNKNSIRHLSSTADGTVFIGQQYRGDPDEFVPLVAMHQRGKTLKHLHAEPEQWARFRHYIASIGVSKHHIVATSPRGNCYGIWERETQDLLSINALPDASGVVVDQGCFFVSSGAGKVVKINSDLTRQSYHSKIQWDNHWTEIAQMR
ncbi:DUF1513 domain-containing protein [Vibrio hippocampi]|nr:DUF1513 domain-containing protein [Vibrio hippocampi]